MDFLDFYFDDDEEILEYISRPTMIRQILYLPIADLLFEFAYLLPLSRFSFRSHLQLPSINYCIHCDFLRQGIS